MTVKELIEELQNHNPEAVVEVRDGLGDWADVEDVCGALFAPSGDEYGDRIRAVRFYA